MSDDDWRELLKDRRWLVARIRGRVVGFASVEYDKPQPCDSYVESIWVVPFHRRRGVLRALVNAAAAPEPAESATVRPQSGELVLWVLEDNDVACEAYRRLGFVRAGRQQIGDTGQWEVRLRRPREPAVGFPVRCVQ